MVTQQLLDYVKICLDKKLSEETIKINLLQAGWSEQDINEAFEKLRVNVVPEVHSIGLENSSEQEIYTGILSFGDLLKRSINLYKSNFISLSLSILFFSLLYEGLLSIILLFIPRTAFMELVKSYTTRSLPPILIVFGVINIILLNIFLNLKNITVFLILKRSSDKLDLKETLRNILKNIPKIALLSAVVNVLLATVLLIVAYLTYFSLRTSVNISALFTPIIVFGLLFIPSIMFSFWYLMAPYTIVEKKNNNIIDSIIDSKGYVGGWWPDLFSRFFLMGVLFFIISFLTNFLIKLFNLSGIIIFGTNFIVATIWGSIGSVFIYSIYQNLKYLAENNIKQTKKPISKFTIGIIIVVILILLFLLFINLLDH
ncbi:MAG: hypothetical protein Q8P53_02395 [Candidatus Shapirobacteria bacterium]|nr:hypothetical protein [Candidatus Shapirobacteria bacterium]